jgi:hypothetical protein
MMPYETNFDTTITMEHIKYKLELYVKQQEWRGRNRHQN